MGLFDGTPLERPVCCDRCGRPEQDCDCPPEPVADRAPSSQRLKLRLEKRKRGKLVTVVSGFECQRTQLQNVLTTLKNHCGAGGTLAESTLELQGDHVDRAATQLRQMGYRL